MLCLHITKPLKSIPVTDMFRLFPHSPLRPNVFLQLISNFLQDLYKNHAEKCAMLSAKNNLNEADKLKRF